MQTETETETTLPTDAQTVFLVSYTKDNTVHIDGVYQYATSASDRVNDINSESESIANTCIYPIILDVNMDLKVPTN